MKKVKILLPIILAGMFILNSGFKTPTIFVNDEEVKQQQFYKMLSFFEKGELPFNIDLSEKIKEKGDLKSANETDRVISAEFQEIGQYFLAEARFSKFSRMGQPIILPIKRVYLNDEVLAVIFSVRYRFARDVREQQYYMACFDLNGNRIFLDENNTKKSEYMKKRYKGKKKRKSEVVESTLIAGVRGDMMTNFSINESGVVETEFFEVTWKGDSYTVLAEIETMVPKGKTVYRYNDSTNAFQEDKIVYVRP